MKERVSLIATVLNEAASIGDLLDSLASQTQLPDEVVIVDGGSSDGTVERIEAYEERAPFPLRALSVPGCNISAGRNAAIEAAQGEIIASTDAGVRLEPDWLQRLLDPFGQDSGVDVVSGFFVPDPQSLFELVLGRVTLPRLEEIDPATFYPSSRSVAFRREAWQAVGGYPEWLDYCEDLLFDFRLRDAGYRFAFAPNAVVHFRPRPNLRSFAKQYYRYARGDGKADFWRYRHLLRYGTYAALVVATILAVSRSPIWWLAVAGVLVALSLGPIRRLAPALPGLAASQRLRALLWAPCIRVTGDVAKMLGYPVGVLWRWRSAPQEPWPKRQF